MSIVGGWVFVQYFCLKQIKSTDRCSVEPPDCQININMSHLGVSPYPGAPLVTTKNNAPSDRTGPPVFALSGFLKKPLEDDGTRMQWTCLFFFGCWCLLCSLDTGELISVCSCTIAMAD